MAALAAIVMAQPAAADRATLSAREQYLVASFTYQSAAAEAALKKSLSAQLDAQKKAIDTKDAELRRQRAQVAAGNLKLRSAVDLLQGQLAQAKVAFADQLAAKDEAFAKERALYQSATVDILKTPEGAGALELYLDGGPGSAEAAAEIVDRLAAKRNATDLRANAQTIGEDGLGHGRLTSAYVIRMWEKVVAADGGVMWDWIRLARLYQRVNRLSDAAAATAKAVALAKSDDDRVAALGEDGDVRYARNDLPGARARYEEGLAVARKRAAALPDAIEAQRAMLVNLNRIGDLLFAQDDLVGALDRFDEGLKLARTIVARRPDNQARRDLMVSLNKLGDILVIGNAVGNARDMFEESLGIARKLAALDPNSADAQRDVVVCLNKSAITLVLLGDKPAGYARHREGLAIVRALAKLDPGSAQAQRDVWAAYYVLASAKVPGFSFRMAVDQAEAMIAKGLWSPADDKVLAELRASAAAETGQ